MGLRLSKAGTHWIAVTRSPYLALTKQPSTALTKKGFWSSGMECLVRQCWRGCQDTPQMYQRCWITERESRALAAWFYRPLVTFVCPSDIFPFLRHEWPFASYYREKNVSEGESKRKKRKKEIFFFFLCCVSFFDERFWEHSLKKIHHSLPRLKVIKWKPTVSHS